MNPPCPKPSKGAAKEQKKDASEQIKKLRGEQARLAIVRDGGYCVLHWFAAHELVPYDEVHHVYGRARRKAGEQVDPKEYWRENYTSLICVCRYCHPQPINGKPGSSAKLAWVEKYLHKANTTPINRGFQHEVKKVSPD